MEIAIIGGGITGLSTALALNKMGLSFQVFEKAPKLTAAGAGIWMQPNALKVLDWMGLGDAIREQGAMLQAVELTDRKLRSFRGNRTSLELEPIVSIHRARLQQVLYDALPSDNIHLDMAYRGHSGDTGEVSIRFSGGSTKAELLLGADGIHSRVRQQLFPDAKIRYSGQTCWRGIAPVRLDKKMRSAGKEAWGNRVRFGFAPISEDEVYWFAVAKAPHGGTDDRPLLKERLLHLFHDFHPIVRDIITETPLEHIIRNDISDLQRLQSWHQGPACLLGDAAHATTPNMGQGGCQGVEDAYYISQFLIRHEEPESAFQQFESFRRKKVDYVVNNSWRFGQMAHSPIGQKLATTLLQLTPEGIVQKQMDQLFAIPDPFSS